MVLRVANFVLFSRPNWLNNDLLDYLPTRSPIGLASMRSLILIAPDDLAKELCPSEKVCVSPDAVDSLARAWDYVSRELHKLLEECFRGACRDIDSIFNEVSSYIDRVVDRVNPTECVGIERLGCFLSTVPSDLRIELSRKIGVNVEGPLIVVNLDLIEELCEESAKELSLKEDSYTLESMKNHLLSSVITHEVTHAFTDLSSCAAPKREFRTKRSTFYYRMIEESLATYYGLAKELDYSNEVRYVLLKSLSSSPLEYRAGLSWNLIGYANEVLKAWTGVTSVYPSESIRALASLIHALLDIPESLITIRIPPIRLRHLIWDMVHRYVHVLIRTFARYETIKKLTSLLWKLLAVKLAIIAPRGNLFSKF